MQRPCGSGHGRIGQLRSDRVGRLACVPRMKSVPWQQHRSRSAHCVNRDVQQAVIPEDCSAVQSTAKGPERRVTDGAEREPSGDPSWADRVRALTGGFARASDTTLTERSPACGPPPSCRPHTHRARAGCTDARTLSVWAMRAIENGCRVRLPPRCDPPDGGGTMAVESRTAGPVACVPRDHPISCGLFLRRCL
jgi:hypothetical protein